MNRRLALLSVGSLLACPRLFAAVGEVAPVATLDLAKPLTVAAPVSASFQLGPSAAPSFNLAPAASPILIQALVPQTAAPAAKQVQPPARQTLSAISGESSKAEEASAQAFDGQGSRPALEPSFEPATSQSALEPGEGAEKSDRSDGGNARRLSLSFSGGSLTALTAIDPAKGIHGAIKRVRDFPASREYWNNFKKGAELDILSRGESVFGRPTTITEAVTKKISKLNKDDFKGIVPDYQLQAPIGQLRASVMSQLEEARKTWNPNDSPVSGDTTVRVVKFKSYLQLFKESNSKDGVPAPEKAAERRPLQIKAEGQLAPLSYFLPRAVFLDVDLLDGPITQDQLSDMMKLQRTGVYFVAFSRKPYAAPGGVREKLIRPMSSYQLSILLPIRFLAVTDDGSVISEFPKGGNVVPMDVESFSDAQMNVLRDAAEKAAEEAGIAPRALQAVQQPTVREQIDEFPGLTKREARYYKDPQVRFELSFAKSVTQKQVDAWVADFDRRLAAQGLEVKATVKQAADGRWSVAAQRTDLGSAMPRVLDALGKKFGLYLNPSDILVLSDKPELKGANPMLDMGQVTGLKGSALLENSLGLLLGEHRENREGDVAGSASRMAQFTHDRTKYLSEFLVAQDHAEQHINFFSGHVVHAANDWLIAQLQNGKKPTQAEYEAEVRRRWEEGLTEFKPVGLPDGEDMQGWLRESTMRGVSMYKMIVGIHDRGEILVGTEIPNFFMLKDFQRRSGDVKRRYILHTIFDFLALRPDPKNPGHAKLVIYDFKTGPAQSRQKLDKDLQVLTYALFANQRWVGKRFPVPYFSGKGGYHIDEARVEFIYNAIKQPTTISRWDLDYIRHRIIGILNRIADSESKLMGQDAKKPAKGKKAKGGKKSADKTPAVKVDASRAKSAGFETLDLPRAVPGIKIKKEFAQQIVKGTKKIEYRTVSSQPKPFVAIIQTFTDEEPGRAAEVVGFARIENVTHNGSEYEYHLTHVTPVTPYVVPKSVNKPGSVIWLKDVPVQGPKRLKGAEGSKKAKAEKVKTTAKVESLPENHLLMRDRGAYDNAVKGVSTVYLRKGTGKGHKKGPGQIDLKDSKEFLPVDFISVEEMPYSKVGKKVLDGLAKGLTWDEMFETMKSYYPGFTADDMVTVIKYKRR